MALTVGGAFYDFYSAINLSSEYRDLANTRRDWVVRRLQAGGLSIVESYSMGSIPRYTALKDHADLDVMVVLDYYRHIDGSKPSSVLSTVRTALGTGAGHIRRNGQAVTITFDSWPNVDVVPAARYNDTNGHVARYEIPDMNREVWLKSNPPQHSRDILAAATNRGPNFRRVITMLKDWNRRQDVKLQSYHLEVIALKLSMDWSDEPWAIFQWFDDARGMVDSCWHADQDVSRYLSYDRRVRVKAQLAATTNVARSAWHAGYQGDCQQAVTLWKSIFGMRFPSYG